MKVFIILSSQCNLRCGYCFYTQKNDFNNQSIDLAALEKFLSHTKDELESEIAVTGGEPFLYKQIFDLTDFILDNNMRVRINSNLILLNQDKINRIKPAVSRMDTTIDHIIPEIHNQLRGKYDKTMEGIDICRKEKIPVGITTTITQLNFKDTDRIYKKLKELNPEYIFFQPVETSSEEFRKKYCITAIGQKALETAFKKIEAWAKNEGYEKKLENIRKFYLYGVRPQATCNMGKETFVIDYTGDVYPCFHRPDLNCGNINKDNPSEIMQKLYNNAKRINIIDCFGARCVPIF